MKTFETEKNNIPEGATHYQEETSICVFAWFKTENEINYYFAPGYENKWVELGRQSEMYDERVKPIPKPEVVEWKNGDECIAFGVECVFIGKSHLNDCDSVVMMKDGTLKHYQTDKITSDVKVAYELYCHAQHSVDVIGYDSFERFKADDVQVKFWLAIADKTNYRKGE